MDCATEKALDRIQKLLALSENNDSPAEAAAAAAHAAVLMEKYSIAEADLVGTDDDDEVVEETFGLAGSHRDGHLKQKSTWQGMLGSVIAPSFGCAVIWRSRKGKNKVAVLRIAGRPQDVVAAIQAKEFCHKEIDRLVAKFGKNKGRGFGASFRLGCVQAIQDAIDVERAALHEAMKDEVSSSALTVVDDRSGKAHEIFGDVKEGKQAETKNFQAYVEGRILGGDVWTGTKKRLS